MILYDYLPSQNAWKVRQLLHHLDIAYDTRLISIFEGEGKRPEYLAKNPTGAVPALELDDGSVVAESNAILWYLADGTPYLPEGRYPRARVLQWLSFEGDYVQSTVATLRHWTLTGKLPRRSPDSIEGKRAGSLKVLEILDRELAGRPYLAGEAYTIADLSVFAYVHRADEAGLDLTDFTHLLGWIDRVRARPRFLGEMHPYSIDPHSGNEL